RRGRAAAIRRRSIRWPRDARDRAGALAVRRHHPGHRRGRRPGPRRDRAAPGGRRHQQARGARMKDGELRDRTPGERAPSRPRRWGGALTAVAGGIAVVLGVIGFSGLPDGAGGTLGLGTSLYRTAQLFTL